MSRRRVSVRDLGEGDCQGWLHHRRKGRSLLGSKWKKKWFVLKKSFLYWYANKTAEKADGFISLSGFTILQTKHCRRKHAITASHPLVETIFVAAETFTEMNMWIQKLSEATVQSELLQVEVCYSEGSDQDTDECLSTYLSGSEQDAAESESADVLRPLFESPPSVLTSTAGDAGRGASEGGERLRGLEVTGGAASIPLTHVRERRDREEAVHENPPDEMLSLYNQLKAASLSPMGRSSRRDFRASFLRRSKDDRVNEKLHLLRILSSMLKAKEAVLAALDRIPAEPGLTASTYREWRCSNLVLVQEICGRDCGTEPPLPRGAEGGQGFMNRDSGHVHTSEDE